MTNILPLPLRFRAKNHPAAAASLSRKKPSAAAASLSRKNLSIARSPQESTSLNMTPLILSFLFV